MGETQEGQVVVELRKAGVTVDSEADQFAAVGEMAGGSFHAGADAVGQQGFGTVEDVRGEDHLVAATGHGDGTHENGGAFGTFGGVDHEESGHHVAGGLLLHNPAEAPLPEAGAGGFGDETTSSVAGKDTGHAGESCGDAERKRHGHAGAHRVDGFDAGHGANLGAKGVKGVHAERPGFTHFRLPRFEGLNGCAFWPALTSTTNE